MSKCLFCGADLKEAGSFCPHCESALGSIMSKTVAFTLKQLQAEQERQDRAIYEDASEILESYFWSKDKDEEVGKALQELKRDEYYDILPLYYGEHFTIDYISSKLNASISTITRNKKRLCLKLFDKLNGEK